MNPREPHIGFSATMRKISSRNSLLKVCQPRRRRFVLSLGNRVSSFEFPPAITAWCWSTTGRTAWIVSLRAEIEARSNYREAERRVSTLLLSKLEKQTGEK
jgi:hypothetical protein